MATRKRSQDKRKRRSRAAAGSFNVEKAIDKGLAHHREGRRVEAARLYHKALEHEPDNGNALNLLGLMALADGFVDDAIDFHERAVKSAPTEGAFHANLGTAIMARERGQAAEDALLEAMKLGFKGVQAPFNLGLLYMEQGRHDDALSALRQASEIAPDHPEIKYLLAALSGEHRDHVPEEYIVGLFDSYATHFDDHLVGALGYRVPALLRAVLDRALEQESSGAPGWRVLDVGCGTGLAGVAFRDLASYLAGCDLSPRMVAVAEERGIYDELEVADLQTYLARQGEVAPVDLIVAADVLIYVGALEETARLMAAALRPGGYALFSIERAEDAATAADGGGAQDAGFELRPSGRFAHRPAYVEALAGRHGFELAIVDEATVRREAHQPLPGQLYLWRKLAA